MKYVGYIFSFLYTNQHAKVHYFYEIAADFAEKNHDRNTRGLERCVFFTYCDRKAQKNNLGAKVYASFAPRMPVLALWRQLIS